MLQQIDKKYSLLNWDFVSSSHVLQMGNGSKGFFLFLLSQKPYSWMCPLTSRDFVYTALQNHKSYTFERG